MLRRLCYLSLLLCLALPREGGAAPRTTLRLDPRLEIFPELQKMRGRSPARGTPALITFTAPPAEEKLEALEHQGVRFSRRDDGGRRRLGRFYPARLAFGALAALHREPLVQRVDLDRSLLPRLRPLDRTASEIQAPQVWNNTSPSGVDEDGQGVVIGSIDSGIDVFHPAFFRADGRLYSWIDANANGIFEPDIDGVDLDGDGALGAGEMLSFFDTRAWDASYSTTIVGSFNGLYDPAVDYLYIDLDRDGERDYGPQFGDATPTFGEPLFVADDVDGNGRLDPQEKVRALGTSKIRAVWMRGEVYQRGVNLSATPNEGYNAAHGNATSGILIGGQRGYTSRVGVAPGADLVLAVDDESSGEGLTWLVRDQQADLVLHEYSAWTQLPLDGSGAIEQLMDEAASLGVPQVVPVGNLDGSQHTAIVEISAGQKQTLSFTAPGAMADYGYVSAIVLSLHWRSPENTLSITLEDPAGVSSALSTTNTGGEAWDETTFYWSYRDDSSRGTARFDVLLQGSDGSYPVAMLDGQWTLTLENQGSSAMQLHAYIADDIYGWASGAAFSAGLPPAPTVCWPSTADSAIGVAAYAGRTDAGFTHPLLPGREGQLRDYSSRGTRIDGQRLVDIAAPDNPLAPVSAFSVPEAGIEIGHGAYSVFGGTSGAGPHVAGAVALLLQHAPELDAEQVRQRLHGGALVDGDVTVGPADGWGAGKLRIFGAIHQKQAPMSTAPQVAITPPQLAYAQQPVQFAVQASDAQDAPAALQLRWDADYDGAWDGPFSPVGPLLHTFPQPGMHAVKVQVRDRSGLTAQALASIEVLAPGTPPPPGVTPPEGPGIKGGCQLGEGRGGIPTVILMLLALITVGRGRRRRC